MIGAFAINDGVCAIIPTGAVCSRLEPYDADEPLELELNFECGSSREVEDIQHGRKGEG